MVLLILCGVWYYVGGLARESPPRREVPLRTLRFATILVAVLVMPLALAGPAQASAPDHYSSQFQGMGAGTEYWTASGNGDWYVNFGVFSYIVNDQQYREQPSVAAGIFDSSCSPDGLSCSGYGVDGVAAVPADVITIDPDLSGAVLSPVELTAYGWAFRSWFDATLGEWQYETNEISITTSVSASFVATGPASIVPYHEITNGPLGEEGPTSRSTYSDVGISRPATATASAFGLTASDPVWCRIARQSNTGVEIYWPAGA